MGGVAETRAGRKGPGQQPVGWPEQPGGRM